MIRDAAALAGPSTPEGQRAALALLVGQDSLRRAARYLGELAAMRPTEREAIDAVIGRLVAVADAGPASPAGELAAADCPSCGKDVAAKPVAANVARVRAHRAPGRAGKCGGSGLLVVIA